MQFYVKWSIDYAYYRGVTIYGLCIQVLERFYMSLVVSIPILTCKTLSSVE